MTFLLSRLFSNRQPFSFEESRTCFQRPLLYSVIGRARYTMTVASLWQATVRLCTVPYCSAVPAKTCENIIVSTVLERSAT